MLNSQTNAEFLSEKIKVSTTKVTLKVMDLHGNIVQRDFNVNLDELESNQEVLLDVNGDGVLNIQDLVFVVAFFGQSTTARADVNADGVVDSKDLLIVAVTLENVPAAPAGRSTTNETDVRSIQKFLESVDNLNFTDLTLQKSIRVLESLLASIRSSQTALLPNYPNPFNPETWIPYQLANDADVTLTLYDTKGVVVRRLDLGHQLAGYYIDRTRAAYWDGRNESGESVTSGIYFYQLRTGKFSAMRKMVILK